VSEGNYLRKRRKNFFLSEDCCSYIEELAYFLGLSEGGTIETAVRELRDRHEEKLGKRESNKAKNPFFRRQA
jgi:hypothetical protein